MTNLTEHAKMVSFLIDISHGPCGGVNPIAYERNLRNDANVLLSAKATSNLESAGAYGRTIERWWDGFYGSYTVNETAAMSVDEIAEIIARESRRG